MEIDILTRTLTPQALNFSEIYQAYPIYRKEQSFSEVFHSATSLNMADSWGISATNVPRNRPPGEPHWNKELEDAGYFTVNAPDIKVFTGFVRDRKFEFGGGIKMKPGKTTLDYTTISLLSLEDGGWLLTATGTMHNTNGEPKVRQKASPWEPDDAYTLENQWGDAPVLCEGIPLELTLPGGTSAQGNASGWLVYPLDEAGNRRAGEPLRFENGQIQVGPECKTLWYEIRAL